MLGLGYQSVQRVVKDSVLERTDRVGLAFLISISVHIPFYIVYALKLNAWWLLILYGGVWTSGVLFIRSRITIPFSFLQSVKLFFLILRKFLKVVLIAIGIIAFIKVKRSKVGLVDSLDQILFRLWFLNLG